MTDTAKTGLWGLAAIAVLGAAIVLASNIALLFYGAHDGQLHVLTVFDMLTSGGDRTATAARLALLLVGGAIILGGGAIWNARRERSLHGSARWATKREIRKAGLRSKRGLIVGKLGGRFLIFGGSEHLFVSAPTRGGKGVGIVIPNLLNWPDSTIVLDVKKENWAITAGFRKQAGQEVYLFDPLAPEGRTARYNPLGYVNRDNPDDLYDDLQRIATMLFTADARATDPFWQNSARTAFIAIAGYVAETPELPFTMGEVLRQMNASQKINEHFMEIVKDRQETRPLSRQCQTAMVDFLSGSDKTLQSIRSTVTSKLNLWLNGRIDAATSANDFDLREIRRRPISIYLGVTPDNLERLAPLLNLFFQQAVDLNARVLPEHDKSLTRQVMLMMDEFRALGNVEVISKGVAFLAGFGFRIVTIVQSPAQLRGVYGHDDAENYVTNHGIEVVFTPKDNAVAKELGERFGTYTVKRKSRSRGIGFSKSNRTESTSDERRALMLPQELVLTPYEEQYVLKAYMPPIKSKKVIYYSDPVFKARLVPPPTVKSVRSTSNSRIEVLEREVQSLRTAMNERVIRAPTMEEVTAAELPADGADGNVWGHDNDIEGFLKKAPKIDLGNPEPHRAAAAKLVGSYFDSIGYDAAGAAESAAREDAALEAARAAASDDAINSIEAGDDRAIEPDETADMGGTLDMIAAAMKADSPSPAPKTAAAKKPRAKPAASAKGKAAAKTPAKPRRKPAAAKTETTTQAEPTPRS